jgi:hypothetical protein
MTPRATVEIIGLTVVVTYEDRKHVMVCTTKKEATRLYDALREGCVIKEVNDA